MMKKIKKEISEKLTLTDVVKSLPIVCKNYINGQCTECELNEHKECNGQQAIFYNKVYKYKMYYNYEIIH